MAVTAGDPPILVVDAELGPLIAADLATEIDGFPLGVVVATGAAGAAAFHVPTPAWVRNNMVGLGVPCSCSVSFVVSEDVFHTMTNSSLDLPKECTRQKWR